MSNDREQREGRGDVGMLVRLAGERRPVPSERLDRVRVAARLQWRSEVRRAPRRRIIWVAAALVAAAAVVVFILPSRTDPSGQSGPTAIVSAAAGTTGTVGEQTLQVGDRVPFGSELRTAESGRITLRLVSGHSVRLDHSSRVRLLDTGDLFLVEGAVYVDSGREPAMEGSFRVETTFGAIRELGTQYEARVAQERLVVRLREGFVELRRGDRSYELTAGHELTIGSGGSPAIREVARYGETWDWLVGITPMPDIEGRSAMEFLEWVARERGFRLEFASGEVATSADRILLDGSVDGLQLDQVLDAVLPTCGMTHRIERGVLHIAKGGSR